MAPEYESKKTPNWQRGGSGGSASLTAGQGLNLQISTQLTKEKDLLHFNHFSYKAIYYSLGGGKVRIAQHCLDKQ